MAAKKRELFKILGKSIRGGSIIREYDFLRRNQEGKGLMKWCKANEVADTYFINEQRLKGSKGGEFTV